MRSAYYVYAIVRRGTTLRPIGGVKLRMVPWRELAAVTTRAPSDGAPATVDAMLHHEAIVEAVREQVPALPVRFGTVMRDAPSVASALAERYEVLAADLERLGDKVELSLTALWASPPSREEPEREDALFAGQGTGAHYLRARAAEVRRDEAMRKRAAIVARKLDKGLGDHALERRVSLVPTPGVAARMAYLVDPAEVDAFRARFDALRRSRRAVRLLLTGPWPPYGFVTRGDTENEAAATGGRLAELAHVLTRNDAGAPRPSGRGAQAIH